MKNLDDLYEMARIFGGIPVLDCRAGSPAHEAGIRYGDILVQMNGRPTPTLTAYVEAQDTDELSIPITVIRNGVSVDLVMVHAAGRGSVPSVDEVSQHVGQQPPARQTRMPRLAS